MNEVVITGIGAISAIGNTVDQIYDSLKNSRHGITAMSVLKSNLANIYPVGEIKLTNDELQRMSPVKGKHSRTTLLSSLAVSEAVKCAKLDEKLIESTSFVSSTTVGGMDTTENCYFDFKNAQNLEIAQIHPCGNHSSEVAAVFGLNNNVLTLSTACSSSSNAIIVGARLIKAGLVDRVIAGGSDALSKFTLNGFKSLMILDEAHCKPFDAERKGLNLGEAAAYIVLENSKVAQKRNIKVLAKLAGYSNVNEAYHQTASSPNGEGAFQAMTKALQMAKITTAHIDYINAHGTGTENNDASESTAINRLFDNTDIFFSSTKAFTGHTLAASGALEAVISVVAIQKEMIPSNLNFKTKIEGMRLTPLTHFKEYTTRNVISNSFGFGGNNTTLVFSRMN
ncbi:beta-ketoacyl-[acyl-carrier-protein] synthase family protein [Maribellus mangrovi]|uniref:beta-ketoacyl-[acyl-carrier-protein] synthase family protein n=1 Tax=Maribellus mangrovi TaxID=3133146 RepID=UPI0030ECBD67